MLIDLFIEHCICERFSKCLPKIISKHIDEDTVQPLFWFDALSYQRLEHGNIVVQRFRWMPTWKPRFTIVRCGNTYWLNALNLRGPSPPAHARDLTRPTR